VSDPNSKPPPRCGAFSLLNLAEGTVKILTAKECLQSAEACLASAHKTKELDTRAALLEFAYEFRTVAKRLERDERPR